MRVSKCFTYTLAKCRHIYMREHEQEPRTAFVLLRPEHYGKRYSRALSTRYVALYMLTAAATYAVTPINIDRAQQWPAGKRIDILYFPPMLTGLPPRDVLLKLRYRDKLQDMLSSPRFYARRDANGRERYGG